MENLQKFSVIIDEGIEKFNEVLSKARCRIFYKGQNRNGGYITEEFAAKLVATLPYTPVKGIFSDANGDYTDHGAARDLGKIYGIVPAEPNLKWEPYLDEDGIEREYATVDVLLFTAIYKEATEIIGKSQSMELFVPSIKGVWEIIDGKRVFKYTDACFLGLQVLGDDTEPCFEGAAFFSLYEDLVAAVKRLEDFSLSQSKIIGGNQTMQINFSISDREKHDLIWDSLNTRYNEADGWYIDYAIVDIFDEYIIAKGYETGDFYKIGYTKDEDAVTLSEEKEVVKVEYLTEAEAQSIETLRKLNNNSLDVTEVFTEKSALEEKISATEQELADTKAQLSTLDIEKQELATAKDELQSQFDVISTEKEELAATVEELKTFKECALTKEKEEVLAKYSKELSTEVLDEFKEKLSEYSVKDLEKELAFAYVESKPNLFASQQTGFVPKETPLTGVEGLISKHKK